jgi:hypothetical protein
VTAHVIHNRLVDTPASDLVGVGVHNRPVGDDGYVSSRPADVNYSRSATIVNFDAGSERRSHPAFDHTNASDARLFGGIEKCALFDLSYSTHHAHQRAAAEM